MGFDVDIWSPKGAEVMDSPAVRAAFSAAEDHVRDFAGGVDSSLHLGCLDCGECISFLFDALGRSGRPPEIWPPEDLLALAREARWPEPESVPTGSRWAYWSARKFLDLCIEHDLGIWFN